MTTRSTLSPQALKKVAKDLRSLQQSPPEDIQVINDDQDLTEIKAWIRGPDGTPYEDGYFKVCLTLNEEYPTAPPKGFFETKIFHPNVSADGEICVSTLKKDWKPELGITKVLLTIKCLLIVPNPESALNEEAGKLLLEQYDSYAHQARLYTKIHAKRGKQEYMRLAAERVAEGATALPGKKVENENPDTSKSNNEDAAKQKDMPANKTSNIITNNVLTTSAANNASSNGRKRSAAEAQEGKDTLESSLPAKQPKVENPLKKKTGSMLDRKKNLRRL